jgi:hypothetical protein
VLKRAFFGCILILLFLPVVALIHPKATDWLCGSRDQDVVVYEKRLGGVTGIGCKLRDNGVIDDLDVASSDSDSLCSLCPDDSRVFGIEVLERKAGGVVDYRLYYR